MQEKIQRYINGKLTPTEIDNLWAKFIEKPDWFEYFITELHLTAIVREHRFKK